MKLTKFVHACVLAEENGHTVLFDPGNFSWDAGLFKVDDIERLDTTVITHEHTDHFHLPFVQALVAKFPEATIVTTPSVAHKLQEAGIQNATTTSRDDVQIFSAAQHAPLEPLGEAPENIAVHFADRLTVGGDRHDLEESKEILALTVTAPWGSMMAAVDMALRLQPKTIFPIHDWHWSEAARQQAYERLEAFFAQHAIRFIKPRDGETVEV